MEKWVTHAFVSMFFAGFASVIARMGLSRISGELGLTVRTLFHGRAQKVGDVATVALMGKGSVRVAMLPAWLVLRGAITLRQVLGAGLMMAGLWVNARK